MRSKTTTTALSLAVLFGASATYAGHWNHATANLHENAQAKRNLNEIEVIWKNPRRAGDVQHLTALELIQSVDPDKNETAVQVLAAYLASFPEEYWSAKATHRIHCNPKFFLTFAKDFIEKYRGHGNALRIIQKFDRAIARLHGN